MRSNLSALGVAILVVPLSVGCSDEQTPKTLFGYHDEAGNRIVVDADSACEIADESDWGELAAFISPAEEVWLCTSPEDALSSGEAFDRILEEHQEILKERYAYLDAGNLAVSAAAMCMLCRERVVVRRRGKTRVRWKRVWHPCLERIPPDRGRPICVCP